MQIILTRSLALSSLAIRARLLEPWSHAMVMDSPTHIIDATFQAGGVRRRPIEKALAGRVVAKYEDAPLPRDAEARAWLYDQVGKAYDWRAIYGWAGAGRDWHDEHAWFCFELIAAAIEFGSDYRFPNRNRVTGRDLQRAARELRALAARP